MRRSAFAGFLLLSCSACGGEGAADALPVSQRCVASALAPVAEISGSRVLMQIRPSQASSCVSTADEPHQVYIDPAVPPKGLLAVFLPGTAAVPAQYPSYLQRGAARGYHVIGLTYVNPRAIGEACNEASGDVDCTGRAREEVLTGIDASVLVAVPPADAIESRLLALLRYLAARRPGEGWNAFVDSDGSVAWHKTSISGHSQGAGHAGYIGKTRRAFRVGMYSGPSDWANAINGPPTWFKLPALTPAAEFFGFIHDPDYIANPASNPTRVIDSWGSSALFSMSTPVVDVGSAAVAQAASQRLLTRACTGPAFTVLNQHNCTMMRGNEQTWDFISYP